MKFSEYINERKKSGALKQNERSKLNRKISKILKPTYFDKIPLEDIFDVLEEHGLVPLQEDNTYWSGILAGGVKKTEQMTINLGWKDTEQNKQYQPVSNAMLSLSYYKMPKSGKYEVIAYVT